MVARDAIHDRVPGLRVADRELKDVLEAPRAELAQEEKPPSEGTGHASSKDARPGDERVPAVVEPFDGGRRRRDTLAADHQWLASIHRPRDRGQLASRPVQVRLDDLEDESRRARGVERVPSSLEHCHSRSRSEPVGGRDHPVRAA